MAENDYPTAAEHGGNVGDWVLDADWRRRAREEWLGLQWTMAASVHAAMRDEQRRRLLAEPTVSAEALEQSDPNELMMRRLEWAGRYPRPTPPRPRRTLRGWFQQLRRPRRTH
jgi:hypothetical protein